jgi:hypothetical protein
MVVKLMGCARCIACSVLLSEGASSVGAADADVEGSRAGWRRLLLLLSDISNHWLFGLICAAGLLQVLLAMGLQWRAAL